MTAAQHDASVQQLFSACTTTRSRARLKDCESVNRGGAVPCLPLAWDRDGQARPRAACPGNRGMRPLVCSHVMRPPRGSTTLRWERTARGSSAISRSGAGTTGRWKRRRPNPLHKATADAPCRCTGRPRKQRRRCGEYWSRACLTSTPRTARGGKGGAGAWGVAGAARG